LGVQKAQIDYNEMDRNCFAKYIEEKANSITEVLEQNMHIGKFNWAQVLNSYFHYEFLIVFQLSLFLKKFVYIET